MPGSRCSSEQKTRESAPVELSSWWGKKPYRNQTDSFLQYSVHDVSMSAPERKQEGGGGPGEGWHLNRGSEDEPLSLEGAHSVAMRVSAW